MANNALVSLFQNNLYPSWKKTPKCPNCMLDFTIYITKSANILRRPIILPCSHMICEHCLIQNRQSFVKCVACNSLTPLDRNKTYREQFDFNFFLLGLIRYIHYQLPYDKQNLNLKTSLTKTQCKVNKEECSECNKEYTDQICISCNVYYCRECFQNVHAIGKALRKHTLTTISTNNITIYDKENIFCKRHNGFQMNYYCLDCLLVICEHCKFEHIEHAISSLILENCKAVPKLRDIIETLKMANEYAIQSQKDSEKIINQLERYASTTIQNVANYFVQAHTMLQILEKEAMQNIKTVAMQINSEITNTQTILQMSEKKIKESIARLDFYTINLPKNVNLCTIVEKTNFMLETTPCQAQFNNLNRNPFHFDESKIFLHSQIQQSDKIEFKIDFKPKLSPFYGERFNLSTSDGCSSEFIPRDPIFSKPKQMNTKPKFNHNTSDKLNINFNRKYETSKQNSSALSTASLTPTIIGSVCESFYLNDSSRSDITAYHLKKIETQKVHVSHIKTPNHFYVQHQLFVAAENEFLISCQNEASYAPRPEFVKLDSVYLVHVPKEDCWYRGLVVKQVSQNVFTVRFIDYGSNIDVNKKRLREISDDLASRPNGAILCSVYKIEPINEVWTDEAAQLMSEIILNQPMVMLVCEDGPPQLVDLIETHQEYPTSIRDALLYLNFGKTVTATNAIMAKRVRELSDLKHKLVSGRKRIFYKNTFKEGEFFKIKILNIVSPHEFYVIKTDHIEQNNKFNEDLNKSCNSNSHKIYVPHSDMICCINYDDIWHRGRVVNVLPKGFCDVWLIDVGATVKVSWKLMRMLENRFMTMNEAVTFCSLSDIDPLKENGMEWTIDAITDFKLLAKNTDMQIFINKFRDRRYEVTLYINKKKVDICVNALLVKNKHAKSTGSESTNIEYNLDPILSENDPDDILIVHKPPTPSTTFRTKIKAVHVVSPSEFYVTLMKHVAGIAKMQLEIQNKMVNAIPKVENWKAGETCFVRTVTKSCSDKFWYRGVILMFKDDQYVVLLRDFGVKVDVNSSDLSVADAVLDRVTDGAIRCHLACVQPTGGISTWSLVAIDEFSLAITKFDALGVSLQGTRKDDSISVILWGMKNECHDALAPSFCEWLNINKILANRGFFHLKEKFTPILQSNSLENAMSETDNFDQWLQSIVETIDKQTNRLKFEKVELPNEDLIYNDATELELNADVSTIQEWLPAKPMEKSIFSAVPTYVDNNCIIYLHDNKQNNFLEQIKYVINQKYEHSKTKPIDLLWQKNQPCLARYHLDNLFYRAVVMRVESNKNIRVQFVDYGNVEECVVSDLRKDVILGHVPIQATRYCLANIKPLSKDGIWQRDVLDFIHAHIVGDICSIRVDTNYDYQNTPIVPCHIKANSIDIAQLLQSKNMVAYSKTSKFDLKVDILYDPYEDNLCEETSTSNPRKKTILKLFQENKTDYSLEDYKKFFEAIALENLEKDVDKLFLSNETKLFSDDEEVEKEFQYKSNSQDDTLNLDIPSEDDEVKLQLGAWYDEVATSKDKDRADSIDEEEKLLYDTNDITSTITTDTKEMIAPLFDLAQFDVISLDTSIKNFFGKATYILNARNIMIVPHLDEHMQRMREMSSGIQTAAKSYKIVPEIEIGMACLALYKVDGKFYRATVKKYNSRLNVVTVLYVDYINKEVVDCKDIRRCPDAYLEVPLRNIQVQLHGVKLNQRLRENDIVRKLGEVIEDKKIFIKIIQHGSVPIVEFYMDETKDELIYQEMITERYYLKTAISSNQK